MVDFTPMPSIDDRYQRAVVGSGAGIWDWDLVEDKLYLTPWF
ncbi:MAG: hypothetical protein ACI8P9_003544 [Parasphingorhabdus sp.]|jgi:hypothetical protein